MPVVAAELDGDGLYGASFLAFLLTNLAGLVATGYFIDRVGVPRPFLAGIAMFVCGLLLGCFAPSMALFVVGRGLQGLGGGAIQAVVSATIVMAWQGAARQRAISWATTSWMVPALVGPLLAGWVAATFDWRWVFGSLAVLALATATIALPRLLAIRPQTGPENNAETDDTAGEHVPLPLTAVLRAIAVAIGTGIVLTGLERGEWPGVALIIAGSALAWRPLQASLPEGFWTGRTPLGAALLLRLLACGVFFGIEAWLPWTVARNRLGSPVLAGMVISMSAFGWTVATWWVDGAITRIGARPILLAASLLLFTGTLLAWFALDVLGAVGPLFLAWGIAGAGMGLCYPVVSTLAMAQAENGREGHLSMMLGLADTLGITAAIGIGGAWLRADAPGALARIDMVWLGLVGVAVLMPLLLVMRRAQFVAAAQAARH